MARWITIVGALSVVATVGVIAVLGRQDRAKTATSPPSPTTTPPTTRALAPSTTTPPSGGTVALPVVACDTQFGASGQTLPPIRPTIQVAVPSSLARGLQFYSNGAITVLGPRDWTCRALVAANGGENLTVTPPGQDPATSNQRISAIREYTGHGPGVQVVCPYFPDSPAGRSAASYALPCPILGPEVQITRPNVDIAQFREVSATGKGDPVVVGAVLYPQPSNPDPRQSTDVASISCRVVGESSLCDEVVTDFIIRQFPTKLVVTTGCPDPRALDAAVRIDKTIVIPEPLGAMPITHCIDDLAGLQYGPPNSDALAYQALLRNIDGRWAVVAVGPTPASIKQQAQLGDAAIHTLFPVAVGQGTYEVTASIFLRSRPSIEAEILGEIPAGMRVYVECVIRGDVVDGPWGPTANWDRVTWSGKRGYVTDEYVDTKDAINDRNKIPAC